jgi:glycosyltransferase involved in cell wall biosynthesis
VITTNVGGLPEYVKHEVTGLIVPPQNPEELAEAIVRFFKENLGAEYMKSIEREKTKFSWDEVVDGIEKLMRK